MSKPKMVLKVHVDKETGNHYMRIHSFKSIVDIKKVKSYTLEPVDDEQPDGTPSKALILTFYDKDGKVVAPKVK